MKKKYMQPEVATTEMDAEQLLVVSDLTIDINSDETGSPEDADARLMFFDILLLE